MAEGLHFFATLPVPLSQDLHHKFESGAMHVDDLYARFALEILAELGDIDIHVAGIVETVVPPDLLEGVTTLEDVVFLVHQHLQKLCLARGNTLLLALDGEGLAFFVEQNAAQFDHLLRFLLLDRAA